MPKAEMRVTILGSGGGAPSPTRETSCVLVREGQSALLLDAGSGVHRLLANTHLLEDIAQIDVVLSHFHFDHVCGLPFLQWLENDLTIWAPGAWLYGTRSSEVLAPLLSPPLAPPGVRDWPVEELRRGTQSLSGFDLRAGAQPHHWAPSVGFRVNDELAYITDTPFENSSVELARGVRHLLHEAWSLSVAAESADRDATAADAGRVARLADVGGLTLVHLNPRTSDFAALANDARTRFPAATVAEDAMELT